MARIGLVTAVGPCKIGKPMVTCSSASCYAVVVLIITIMSERIFLLILACPAIERVR